MSIGDQFKRVKENWLLLVVVVAILLVFSGGLSSFSSVGRLASTSHGFAGEEFAVDSAVGFPGRSGGGIAPDIEERIRTISASLTAEVTRGTFDQRMEDVHNIITETNSLLINENVYRSGEGLSGQTNGNFFIRVPSNNYETMIDTLQELGEVTSFSEDTDDITSTFTNLGIELAAEHERLARYQTLLASTTDTNDRLMLIDRIFEQERRIAYLEERLNTQGQRVDYASVQLTVREEASSFAGIAVITIDSLVRSFVGSLSSLIRLIVVLLPYAVAVWGVWFVWRRTKKRQ